MGILDNLKTNGFAMDYLNIWEFQEKYDITWEKVDFRIRSHLARSTELRTKNLILLIVIKNTVFYI